MEIVALERGAFGVIEWIELYKLLKVCMTVLLERQSQDSKVLIRGLYLPELSMTLSAYFRF